MIKGILLMMGTDLTSAAILFVVFASILFFCFRFLFKKLLKRKSKTTINVLSGVLAILLAPLAIVGVMFMLVLILKWLNVRELFIG
jgi:hypothetical protein